MNNTTLLYGIKGFFGNGLCHDYYHVLGALDIEAVDPETSKQLAEQVIHENTDWDMTHWHGWKTIEKFNNRKQVSRHSQEIRGRCPEYHWIQNYIQFVLLVFEDNNTPTLREQYLGKGQGRVTVPDKL